MFSVVIAEAINIMKATQRKTAQELIMSYIGFKSIIDVPNIYYGSIGNLPIKGDVGKLTATQGRKDVRADHEKMPGHGVANAFYVLFKWFYNSFYFYFFTFSVISLPFTQVLFVKETMAA